MQIHMVWQVRLLMKQIILHPDSTCGSVLEQDNEHLTASSLSLTKVAAKSTINFHNNRCFGNLSDFTFKRTHFLSIFSTLRC